MKLKELNIGDDFVNIDAKNGAIIMRVKGHLKSNEIKVSLLAYGTTGYMISSVEVIKVPKEREGRIK